MITLVYDLVIIGSPSFDRIVRDSRSDQKNILSGPSIMTAVTAARLGIENMVVVGSLAPEDSSLLSANLEHLHVPEFFRVESPETGGFEIEYNGGPEPSFTKLLGVPRRIRIRDIPDEFLAARFIVLSPLLQEIDAELVEWLCNSSTAVILLDPQLRVPKNGGAIGIIDEIELASKTSCYLDFILPNEKEACLITGENDPYVSAEILVDTLSENCIITRGVHGSILFNGTEFKIIPSYKATALDVLGAGSAYLAGFVAGLLDEKTYDYCAALGASAASFKVSGTYTDFSLNRTSALARAIEIESDIKVH